MPNKAKRHKSGGQPCVELRDLIHTGGVSATGLAEILQKLETGQLPTAVSASSVKRARNERLDI